MAVEWTKQKIGSLGRVVTGKTPTTSNPHNFNGSYPFVTIPDLDGRVFINKTERTLSEEGAKTMLSSLLPTGAVMMSCIATVGKCGITTKSSFTNQQINSLICRDGIHPRYIYYCFTELGHALEAAGGGGSVYTNVSKSRFSAIEVMIPPLKEQCTIARILGLLDDKIELNRQMNETLEAMARAIFKSWFVDFDPVRAKAEGSDTGLPLEIAALFPEHFEDSEIGEIPTSWKIERFEKILHHSTERIGSGQAVEYSATVTGLTLRGNRFNKQLSKTREKNKKIVKGDLVFGLSRKIVNFGLMKENIGSVSPVYEIFKVNSDVYIPELLEMQIRYDMSNYIDILKPSAREGQGIDREYFLSKVVLVPDMSVQKKYYQIYSILQQKIENNVQQSRTLTQIRDALLPKLMSGEIRVDNITS